MNEVQQIILDIVNAYRIEKIKRSDQYIQKVKDLTKIDIYQARIQGAKSKLECASNSLSILQEILQFHPINKVPDQDVFGIFSAIQEINSQTIEYLNNQLKEVI